MAEAIVNARLGEKRLAFNAGIDPAGHIHRKALQALAEIGMVHEGKIEIHRANQ
jgi:hypothetical protein